MKDEEIIANAKDNNHSSRGDYLWYKPYENNLSDKEHRRTCDELFEFCLSESIGKFDARPLKLEMI